MKLKHYIVYSIALLFWGINNNISAQEKEVELPKKIVIKALAKSDAILLRWAVTDKYAWKYSNKYGFIVERTTVLRDGKPLVTPEKILLSGDTIRPKPPVAWKNFIQENDMAAIAAQAIYGETFQVNNEEENQLLQVFYESEELDRRFGFSLFAIDQDFEVAQYAGLGFVDTNVKENEKYLYNVKSAIPIEEMKVDPLGIFISTKDIEELPKPSDFFGYFYQNAFVLVWEYDQLLPYYTAYNLERSEDGKVFEKINTVPITKLADTPYSGISYTDSIPQYGKKYWYRITGINYFSETSPPSDPAELIGFKEIKSEPLFTNTNILSENEVALEWTFAEEELWKVRKYELLRAETAIGPYKTVVDSIVPTQTKIKYSPLSDINYFKIKAFGKNQDYKESPPVMVQPVDSIPPQKPKGLEGTIDTLGIVTLKWNKNTELDLRGYDIIRAYRKDQEFTKLNKANLIKENFIDSIDMTSFDKAVYYRLIALDNRYNESKPSDTLVLQKPDRIPPTSPVFKTYEIKDGNVDLTWINSSVEDWKSTIIYREEAKDSINQSWQKVFETSIDTITNFTDTKANPGKTYRYTLITVDQGDLESEPSPPIVINIPGKLLKPGIKGLYATVDREQKFIQLTWRFNDTNAVEIQVYRKTNTPPFTLYQRLDIKDNRWIDQKIIPNTTYTYAFKAIFMDGSISEWEEIEVKY
ncbi:fibronectin type III domain-containing protein [Aquimarina muelleri]|uniref:fibronectin type III domain-containing protein n=1 Tax=Aquimarina muelleri TaxID=279356 RepID=UPI003F6891F8